MPYKGIDTASPISVSLATALRDGGYSFAIRYIDDSWGRSWKTTKDAEIQILHSFGLGYIPLYESDGKPEDTPDPMNTGMYDAQHAMTSIEGWGYPAGYPIIFAAGDKDYYYDGPDNDHPSWGPAAIQYVTGIRDIVARAHAVWIYGPYDLIDFLSRNAPQFVDGYHQAFAPAWSRGRNANRHPKADIQQTQNGETIAGVGVDLDDSNWEGWTNMALTDDDKKYLQDNVVKPIVDAITSGFNTTLPVLLTRVEKDQNVATGADQK